MTRFVAIGGRKGGVGKTTTTIALASALVADGHRVLVVDLDPQGSATIALSGADDGGAAQLLASGDLAGMQDLGDGLLLLAGGVELGELSPPFADLRKVLGAAGADVVLFDLPPGHPALDRAAAAAADVLLICAEPHRLAIAGAARVIAEAETLPRQPRVVLVLGRLDLRRTLDRAATDMVPAAFPGVRTVTVRTDSTLAAALNAGRLPTAGRWRDDFADLLTWTLTDDENHKHRRNRTVGRTERGQGASTD